MISKEQQRSNYALNQLDDFQVIEEDFANFIVGAPTMILENGFAQTMAFLLSKCDKQEKRIRDNKHYFTFQAIAGWSRVINPDLPESAGTYWEFFKAMAALDQQAYLQLQEEALKMLQWLKRYARAFQGGV